MALLLDREFISLVKGSVVRFVMICLVLTLKIHSDLDVNSVYNRVLYFEKNQKIVILYRIVGLYHID